MNDGRRRRSIYLRSFSSDRELGGWGEAASRAEIEQWPPIVCLSVRGGDFTAIIRCQSSGERERKRERERDRERERKRKAGRES
jgi:hypothetical protein